MLPYDDNGRYDNDGYHRANAPDPGSLDWANNFDDFDAANWEDYLGGPDDTVFETFEDSWSDR